MLARFDIVLPPGSNIQSFTIAQTHKGNSVVHFADDWGIFVSRAWERHDGGVDILVETWGEIPYRETYMEMTTETLEEAVREIVGSIIRQEEFRLVA